MASRRIRDALATGEPILSFEFFPAKTDAGERTLWRAIRELESLQPDFVSVTYGAGGSGRERTLSVTERIATETTLLPLGHLTAVDHSIADLRRIIGAFGGAGVMNVLALRGDPPGDPQGAWVQHPEGLQHASELVELLRASGDFCVGVAAAPGGHPRSPDLETDARHLVNKFRAGADYAITQMFFRAEDYLELRDRVVALGCDAPIIPEIMPVTSLPQIERFAELAGTELPVDLVERLHAVADDPAAVRAVGLDAAVALSERMLAEGAPGLHLITLNRSETVREIWDRLDLSAVKTAA